MTTIIHIEDDPLWAGFVEKAVRGIPRVRLFGTAATGAEGFARCREMSPDIVVLDLRLPDVNGLAMIEKFGALKPAPRLLLFTACADDAVLEHLFDAPVAGMLWKLNDIEQEFRAALQTIANAGTYYSTAAIDAWERFTAAPDSYVKILTPTERRALTFFAEGCSDAEVTERLGGRPSTMHTHRKNIMGKLGVHSQSELQAWAMKHGVFDPPRSAPPCGSVWSKAKAR